MFRPKLTDLESFAKEYKLVPICKEIYADIITPITLLRKLSRISQQYFLLESVEGGENGEDILSLVLILATGKL